MHISNPFQDKDFAQYQLNCHKAQAIEIVNDQIIYVFHLFKKYTILYTNKVIPELNTISKKHHSVYTLIENTKQKQNNQPTNHKIKEIIPRHTRTIDLNKTEDQILSDMHSKGRYNIRLSKKHGIKITESKDTKSFYKILEKTAKRDNFYINPLPHYQEMINHLEPKAKAKLFLAYHPDKPNQPIAGIINTYIQNTATYYYGASDHDYRKHMAPYLLQWHAIKDAKSNNYHIYDFLGIADPNQPKDPLKGVSSFKRKFGGQKIQFEDSKIIIHKPILYFALKIKKLLKI